MFFQWGQQSLAEGGGGPLAKNLKSSPAKKTETPRKMQKQKPK